MQHANKGVRLFGFTPAPLFPSIENIPVLDLRSKERREQQEKQKRIASYNATISRLWSLVLFVFTAGIVTLPGRDRGGDGGN